jgi:uncharacterized delta-60 repeat protein
MSKSNRFARRARSLAEPLELRRLMAAGGFDTSFSGDGIATPVFNHSARDVAVQADGKTIVVGSARNPSTGETQFAVQRLNLDGTRDQTFGNFGLVNVPVGDLKRAFADAVAIAPDGKIVVVGGAKFSGGFDETELAVIRLNPDGALDPTFNGGGKLLFDPSFGLSYTSPDNDADVAVQPDGRIVIVSGVNTLDGDFNVVRLNTNGSFDRDLPAFGSTPARRGFDFDGRKSVDMGGFASANSVKLDDAGNIYVTGHIDSRTGVLKLNSFGQEVSSFDGNGKLSFAIPGATSTRAQDLLVQGGKVIVTGTVNGPGFAEDVFVARFNADGTLDTTFGGNGKGFRTTNFGGTDSARGIAPAAVGGGFVVSGRTNNGMVLAKYTSAGVLDTTFGAFGLAKLGIGGTASVARGPGRRYTLAGGDSFNTARVLDTGANVVFVAASSSTTEGSATPGQIIVGRTERLPFATRVFIGIGGTASGRTFGSRTLPSGLDYTLDKVVQPPLLLGSDTRPFVDIPANETFVVVNLTTRNDTQIEGTEIATFSVLPDASYEIGTPSTGQVRILDDDATSADVNVADDAFVRDGSSANANFGTDPSLVVKTDVNANSGFNRVSYLKFDLASFPVVSQAKLAIFGRLSDGANTNVKVNLFSVADTTWSGATLTFNNKPAPGATPLTSATVLDTALRRYEFDVSAYVKRERELGRRFVSFMLQAPTATTAAVIFNSGNAAASRPVLSVVAPKLAAATTTLQTTTLADATRVTSADLVLRSDQNILA